MDTKHDFEAAFATGPALGDAAQTVITSPGKDKPTKLVPWQARRAKLQLYGGAGNAGGVNAEPPSGWEADRTRPLCPWPQVARYVSGNPELAGSFRCAP